MHFCAVSRTLFRKVLCIELGMERMKDGKMDAMHGYGMHGDGSLCFAKCYARQRSLQVAERSETQSRALHTIANYSHGTLSIVVAADLARDTLMYRRLRRTRQTDPADTGQTRDETRQ